MRTRTAATAALLLLLLCTSALLLAQTADALFQQARDKEIVDGDIPAAIQIYERIVQDFASNRALVAQSLLQLGECYSKLNQPARSREYFERIVDQFKDQAQPLALATTRLNELLRNLPATAARGLPVAPPLPAGAVTISTPYTDDPLGFALSPDGRSLVYQAIDNGSSQLWLRQVNTGQTRALPGTNTSPLGNQSGGSLPFWSPDSRSIGFFADGKLKTLDVARGIVNTLTIAPVPRGGTWSKDDVIIYAPSNIGPLFRIPASGGEPVAATKLLVGQESLSHRHPYFLPDGRRFLYVLKNTNGILLGSLDSLDERMIFLNGAGLSFAPPDNLIFATNAGLWAQRLEMQTLAAAGSPRRLAEGVAFFIPNAAEVSASAAGSVAYRAPSETVRQMVWRDRGGRQAGSVSGFPKRRCCVRLSPDGLTVAFGRDPSTNNGIGVLDLRSGQERGWDISGGDVPVWSLDGRRLAYSSQQNYVANLFSIDIDGSAPVRFLATDEMKYPNDWSKEGLLYQRLGATSSDLFVLPLSDGKPAGVSIALAATAADERNGRFSPDGRWVVYEATDGNGYEIYVQRFPGSAASRKKISGNGGTSAQWGRGGREIYFLSRDNHLMLAAVTASADGQDLTVGRPAPLFKDSLRPGSEYAVTPDGERFLINEPVETTAPPIIVLSNWDRGKQ